jgi:DNA-binding FadR family transcriptional regulator
MPIETVTPRRLYRQVADQLRLLIDRGEFAVGMRLPTERELAQQLGISRPTVREALIALEVDGRVHIRVGSGIYVLPPAALPAPGSTVPMAGPFELLQARALFEGAVAEQAAMMATGADIRSIDAVLMRMREALHSGPDSMDLDRAFHTTVADLFDQRINPYFAQLASYFEDSKSWGAALAEHETIRDRIAANDGPGAREAMRAHLQSSQNRFTKSFGSAYAAKPRSRNSLSAKAVPRSRQPILPLSQEA